MPFTHCSRAASGSKEPGPCNSHNIVSDEYNGSKRTRCRINAFYVSMMATEKSAQLPLSSVNCCAGTSPVQRLQACMSTCSVYMDMFYIFSLNVIRFLCAWLGLRTLINELVAVYSHTLLQWSIYKSGQMNIIQNLMTHCMQYTFTMLPSTLYTVHSQL